MSITRERLNELAGYVADMINDESESFIFKQDAEAFAHALLKAVEAEMEVVGHGLFDSEGKCHAIGRHRSSMRVGNKAFKSEPLIRLPLVKDKV